MTKNERLSHFFQSDGRTVLIPMDAGIAIPVPGLESPGAMIEALHPHVDAFATNLGPARAFREQIGEKGLCLRTDGFKPPYGENPDEGSYRLFGADDAEAVGAQAVMNMMYSHHRNEAENIRDCADLISECMEAEIPVLLEALPFAVNRPDEYTIENIGFAVRVAAELGADLVKTAFPIGASVNEFRAIIETCFVPVLVLGGAAMHDDAALLRRIKNAIDAGAAGVAIGRNVWQHQNPAGMAAALSAIVHDGATVESALRLV